MFKRTGLMMAMFSLSLMSFASVTMLRAGEWDKKTVVEVNEAIEVPGATLQPGKYVFLLDDSRSNRHIVRIMDEKEQKLITTVIAIPNERLEPTGDTVFQFYETPKGQPEALRAWFYPGDLAGQEFAYSEDRAMMIAKNSKRNVPILEGTGDNQMARNWASPEGKKGEMNTAVSANMDWDKNHPYTSSRHSVKVSSAPSSTMAKNQSMSRDHDKMDHDKMATDKTMAKKDMTAQDKTMAKKDTMSQDKKMTGDQAKMARADRDTMKMDRKQWKEVEKIEKELKEFLNEYPNSELAPSIRQMLQDIDRHHQDKDNNR